LQPKLIYNEQYQITKQFSFETGHALYGYDGKCKMCMGSYKLSVTVLGKPLLIARIKYGMVIDFTDLKKIVREIVDEFDHALFSMKLHLT
jgi:6-pyruvoyltetrahydropterin/6-carboxytetrahydropterin synthase